MRFYRYHFSQSKYILASEPGTVCFGIYVLAHSHRTGKCNLPEFANVIPLDIIENFMPSLNFFFELAMVIEKGDH